MVYYVKDVPVELKLSGSLWSMVNIQLEPAIPVEG